MTKRKKNQSETFISSCEIERLNHLEEEFRNSEEFVDISARQNVLYQQLKNGMPDELKPVLIDCWDYFTQILTIQQRFFYKYGFSDAAVVVQALSGERKDIRLNIHIS